MSKRCWFLLGAVVGIWLGAGTAILAQHVAYWSPS
jgi:hypothetical protein